MAYLKLLKDGKKKKMFGWIEDGEVLELIFYRKATGIYHVGMDLFTTKAALVRHLRAEFARQGHNLQPYPLNLDPCEGELQLMKKLYQGQKEFEDWVKNRKSNDWADHITDDVDDCGDLDDID